MQQRRRRSSVGAPERRSSAGEGSPERRLSKQESYLRVSDGVMRHLLAWLGHFQLQQPSYHRLLTGQAGLLVTLEVLLAHAQRNKWKHASHVMIAPRAHS